jgi:L-asparaginase II
MDVPQNKIENEYSPIYHIVRGGVVESVHYGSIAVVNSSGKLVAWYGNPSTISFFRSSAKPLQAISLIEMGGVDRFSMTGEEIAITCASHSSTDLHLKTIYQFQKKIGVTESDLRCCTHQPSNQFVRAKLRDQGLSPTQNHHNCSGKHTGMLGLAAIMNVSAKDYIAPDHPIQKQILTVMAEMCGLETSEIKLGIDGCSVPTFAMPLFNAALGWARLVDPQDLPDSRKIACQVITQAMVENPYFVAGPGRFDTRLMEAGEKRIISKAGAESYQTAGLFPDPQTTDTYGYGIALKISDGDQGKRARKAVMIEILRQLKILSSEQISKLEDIGPYQEYSNQCQRVIGEGKPCFQLKYS